MGDPSDRPGASAPGASPRRRPSERRGGRRVDTRDPRRSRERALKILFQADVRGEPAGDLLARIVDDPRAWAMLDDLDPEASADLTPAVDAADATADPEPHAVALEARRRKALELDGFTRSLVQGVADHADELDELIQRYARRWTVARMPAIDRNLLRLGAYELSHETTSPAVVINEVIELAKRLSTEDSGRYVNGVLEAVRKHLASDRAASPTGAIAPELDPVVADAVDPADRDDVDDPPTPERLDGTVGRGPDAPLDVPDDVDTDPAGSADEDADGDGDREDDDREVDGADDADEADDSEAGDDGEAGDGDEGADGQQQLF